MANLDFIIIECEVSMTFRQNSRPRYVVGPDGSPLTIADLPDSNAKRWVIRRKAQVVAAVQGGLLSLEDACERYRLTMDEFLTWKQSVEEHGLDGLRVTKIQEYRSKSEEGDGTQEGCWHPSLPNAGY